MKLSGVQAYAKSKGIPHRGVRKDALIETIVESGEVEVYFIFQDVPTSYLLEAVTNNDVMQRAKRELALRGIDRDGECVGVVTSIDDWELPPEERSILAEETRYRFEQTQREVDSMRKILSFTKKFKKKGRR